MAAISGLFLLGLAFYGQPAMYLHQARVQWDSLIDMPAPDQAADADHDAAASRMALLQQKVTRLEDELSARQALAPSPVIPELAAPAPGHDVAAQPENPQPASGNPVAAKSAAPRPPEAAQQTPRATASAVKPVAPTILIPQHRETAGQPVPPTPEFAKADQSTPEPPRAASRKPAAPKAVPAPPPILLQPRQGGDEARSVLARLRQLTPAVAPIQQVDVLPPAEPRPRPVASPSIPRLTAARSALANGRIDDARRLLQEAQLQLVFRPVGAADEDPPSVGKGASDVANALEALSANDVPLGRRYIDIAMADLSGAGSSPPVAPIQESQMRAATGYAPAYPPR
jgi:hypothetical protein